VGWRDGSTLTIDGHHRIVRRWRDGLKFAEGIIVPQGLWEPFLLPLDEGVVVG
jgi:hypothetical protein